MSLAPDKPDDVAQDLAKGLKLIQAKQPEYQRREEYYRGERHEVIAHPKLRTLLDRYGEAFGLNYAAVPCDALADRIDLISLTTGNTTLDNLLNTKLWVPNDLDDDADDIHLHAYYLGDYYLIAEYIGADDEQDADDDDTDGGAETGTGAGTVELTPKHPESTIVVYQRSNSRIPDFAVQMVAGESDGEWDAFVYYDDETWEFTTKENDGKVTGFNGKDYILASVDDDGQPDPVANEVGLFPVFHFRPDEKPYGQPINSKMYGPQDAITKINATQMASMDYYGFPQRYALLDPNAAEDDDIDDDFNDDGTVYGTQESDLHQNPGGRSKLSSDPGGMWMLNGVKGTGQFEAADPKGFLDPLTFQIRAGATLSRTPLYEFDLDGSGQTPSGEARRRADGPITKHATKIQGQFGGVWAAIGKYALTALDRADAGKPVKAVWAPTETATDTDGINLVGAKIMAGVPMRQALIEAGYDAKVVDDWYPTDDGYLDRPMSPAQLESFGKAMQSLGNAKTLGSTNADQLGQLVAVYFGVQVQGELPDINRFTANPPSDIGDPAEPVQPAPAF